MSDEVRNLLDDLGVADVNELRTLVEAGRRYSAHLSDPLLVVDDDISVDPDYANSAE